MTPSQSAAPDRPEVVAWDLAQKVAVRVAGHEPLASSYHYQRLHSDFAELTAQAEELVVAETGLVSLAGPARARVVERADWVRANISSFQRLLRPFTDRVAERLPASGVVAPFARGIAGLELGTLLGWMSTRVLGQYDLLVVEDEDPDDQDVVYYVGPNILSLEKRFSFPPREFRLWIALHEVTHRAQFTGVPWMREHFLGLVESSMRAVEPDPKRLLYALQRSAESLKDGRNPLDDGLMGLFASPEQRDVLDRIAGLMSLLEGHGDTTMDRAGADQIPSAERFGRVLRQRRQQAGGVVRVIQKLIGLDAKIAQYEQGERFIEAVERHAGVEAIERVWESPEALPDLGEIRDPQAWLTRQGLLAA